MRKKNQRFGRVVGIKSDDLMEYKRLHTVVWPFVLEKMKDANIQNFTHFLQQFDNGEYYLFNYLEYTGEDFIKDCEILASYEKVQEWFALCLPSFLPLKNKTGNNPLWSEMEELFHLD